MDTATQQGGTTMKEKTPYTNAAQIRADATAVRKAQASVATLEAAMLATTDGEYNGSLGVDLGTAWYSRKDCIAAIGERFGTDDDAPSILCAPVHLAWAYEAAEVSASPLTCAALADAMDDVAAQLEGGISLDQLRDKAFRGAETETATE
jgi:hypothetical protein